VGAVEERRKDYERADDYYQRALTLEPRDKDINFHYAEFLRHKLKNKK
jgi:Tfp pilus assembly protein PilF